MPKGIKMRDVPNVANRLAEVVDEKTNVESVPKLEMVVSDAELKAEESKSGVELLKALPKKNTKVATLLAPAGPAAAPAVIPAAVAVASADAVAAPAKAPRKKREGLNRYQQYVKDNKDALFARYSDHSVSFSTFCSAEYHKAFPDAAKKH